MRIGELKHPITFVESTTTTTANGFKQTSWTVVKKAWASITKQERSLQLENDKIAIEHTLLFTIRYQDIDLKTLRIEYRGKQYEILEAEDKDFSKRFLTLSVKEVV